jgi:hypothetical protein
MTTGLNYGIVQGGDDARRLADKVMRSFWVFYSIRDEDDPYGPVPDGYFTSNRWRDSIKTKQLRLNELKNRDEYDWIESYINSEREDMLAEKAKTQRDLDLAHDYLARLPLLRRQYQEIMDWKAAEEYSDYKSELAQQLDDAIDSMISDLKYINVDYENPEPGLRRLQELYDGITLPDHYVNRSDDGSISTNVDAGKVDEYKERELDKIKSSIESEEGEAIREDSRNKSKRAWYEGLNAELDRILNQDENNAQ